MNSNQQFHSVAVSAGIIGATSFIGAIVGFCLQLLVAYSFGASNETDSFFMAQSTSELLSKLLMGGSITAAFIPLFIDRMSRGKKIETIASALNLFHILALSYGLLIIIMEVYAHPFIQLIAPGFDDHQTLLTVRLLRVLLPSFFFLFMIEYATSILHSVKQFFLPASLRIVAPAISIISVLLFTRSIGIWALAVGALAGSVIQFGILATGLWRQGFSYRFVFWPRDPFLMNLIILVYPFIGSVLMTQVAGIVYRIIVSNLTEGSLASLKFAEKITQFLTIVFLNSVTVVMYPLLSEKASANDTVGVRDTIAFSLRLVFFITVPLVIGLSLLSREVVTLIFERGSFSHDDTVMTSQALMFLSLGLLTNTFSSILGHAVLAFKKTKAAVAITIISQIVAIALFLLLVPPLEHAGLALASSLVPISAALLYFLYLSRHVPKLYEIFRHPTMLHTIVLGAGLFVLLITLKHIGTPRMASDILTNMMALFIPAVAGSTVFFGAAYVLHVPEMTYAVNLLKQIVTSHKARES